jgi:regulator of sirC expression with transglutaminase-like and TPR domain
MISDVSDLGLLDDEEIELDLAALALSELDHDGVDLEPYLDLLQQIEDRLESLGGDARSPEAQAQALARVFALEFGFTGDAASYDAPLNADLIRVLDRRQGLPVSLSLLYVAIARRLGWSAHVLGTPGHVLVRIGDEPYVVLDPFHGGDQLDERQLTALVQQFAGPGASFRPEYLAPAANRTILIRLLQNQATRAEASGDAPRALTLYQRMTLFAPGYPDVWWQLARMQLQQEEFPAARHSLNAMLEVTRAPDRRQQIKAALAAIPIN